MNIFVALALLVLNKSLPLSHSHKVATSNCLQYTNVNLKSKTSNIFQAKIFENILTVCPVPPTPSPPSRLADLMEEHQEELATIESIDSGAVYTLALKTHVGMSIQTFRYFAGWCDKIQVCLDKQTGVLFF